VNKLHILMVNLNNLFLTKNSVSDLMKQNDGDFDLTLVDNASSEEGTDAYLDNLAANGVTVIRHKTRVMLNAIWNTFYEATQNPYLCLLNNDVRIPCNFVSDTIAVLDKEQDVGVAVHATNNEQFMDITELKYEVMSGSIRQGWDMTWRRTAYTKIPDCLGVYFGDDFLYAKLYEKGWKAAMIFSSPLIHFLGQSIKSVKTDQFMQDQVGWNTLHLPEFKWSGYSNAKPGALGVYSFKTKLKPLLTVNMVTYARYEEIKQSIEMYLEQTDPRFVLDIWQDGKDDKKRDIVMSFKDPRIHYNENLHRANKYGHDMRNRSIMQCRTEYWCTTNDDNHPSPVFVEEVLKAVPGHDMLRFSVAMGNLPVSVTAPIYTAIRAGCMDNKDYENCVIVLDPNTDAVGRVDACSFVVRTDRVMEVGWRHMEFHGDWLTYEDLIKKGLNVQRLNKVLQIHR